MNLSTREVYVISDIRDDSMYLNGIMVSDIGDFRSPSFGPKGATYVTVKQVREALAIYDTLREIDPALPEAHIRKLRVHYDDLEITPEDRAQLIVPEKKRVTINWSVRHGSKSNLATFSRTMENHVDWETFNYVAAVLIDKGSWDWPSEKFVGNAVASRRFPVGKGVIPINRADWREREFMALALSEEVDLTFLTLSAPTSLKAYKFRTGEILFGA